MTVKINFPKAGMGLEDGTVVRWLRSEGDRVIQGETLVEIETAKAIQNIVAPSNGVLSRILLQAGETGAVNSTLGLIEE
jgi:pyruvate/2-oxoglutarate dehydrogenase complex dihydrolipoamide acyltransferase (E2) component